MYTLSITNKTLQNKIFKHVHLPHGSKALGLVGLSTLSIAVSMAIMSNAQAARVYDRDGVSLDVFGKVRAAFVNKEQYRDIADQDKASDGNSLYGMAQFGIAGRSTITTGADAIAMALWETTNNDDVSRPDYGNQGALDKAKYMYVGIDGYQYGTLIFGRGDNAFYTVSGATDIFNVIEGNAYDYYLLGEQRPSMLMYSLRALSWDFKFSYMFDTNELGATPLSAERGYAVSVSTKFGDKITLAYGYEYTKFDYDNDQQGGVNFFANMLTADGFTFADAQHKANRQRVDSKQDFGVVLSYGTLGTGLYGAFGVGATKYEYMNHHIYTVDTAVNYTFDNGFGLTAGYGLKKYESIDVVSELNLGVSYEITPAFKLFAEAQLDLNGEADKLYGAAMRDQLNLNENKFAIGAEINF